MSRPSGTRAYKEVTSHQLRSFWETANLGTFTAAARRLNRTPATIWKQIRAVEKSFGIALFRETGRGNQLTEAGKILAELTCPLVDGVASLRRRFEESLGARPDCLTVVTTPRILCEDMPECLEEFRKQRPRTQLRIREAWKTQVHRDVEAGLADLGLVMNRSVDLSRPWIQSPWLAHRKLYELAVVLIAPLDHPLVSRKKIDVKDLVGHPMVNARNSYPGLHAMAMLEKEGVLDVAGQSGEGFFAPTMRKMVAAGLGIALVERLEHGPSDPGLHERVLPQEFGRPQVYGLSLKNVPLSPAAEAFEQIVRQRLAAAN